MELGRKITSTRGVFSVVCTLLLALAFSFSACGQEHFQTAPTKIEDFKGKLSIILGEAYRRNGEWKFKAIGEFGPYGGSSGISQMRERVKQLI